MKAPQSIYTIPALLVALGIAMAGFFIGKTLYNAQVGINTAQAKGLSERQVTADQANWTVSFSVSDKSRDDIAGLYGRAEANRKAIVDILRKGGLSDEEIETGIIDYGYKEYRNENNELVDETHSLRGSLTVRTEKVELIKSLRSSVNSLVAQGLDITNNPPQYLFTRLNDIKPDMLKEAARNARIAATEFASNAGAEVGKIRSARQGAFIIVDLGENYGDTKRLRKNVRVVTTIDFYLTD